MDSSIRSQFPVPCQLNMTRIIIVCDEDYRRILKQITFGHNIKPQMVAKPLLYFFVYDKLQNPSSRSQKNKVIKTQRKILNGAFSNWVNFQRNENEPIFFSTKREDNSSSVIENPWEKKRESEINSHSILNHLVVGFFLIYLHLLQI
jgi:hypothetical protein